jgi:hypothetical protein
MHQVEVLAPPLITIILHHFSHSSFIYSLVQQHSTSISLHSSWIRIKLKLWIPKGFPTPPSKCSKLTTINCGPPYNGLDDASSLSVALPYLRDSAAPCTFATKG